MNTPVNTSNGELPGSSLCFSEYDECCLYVQDLCLYSAVQNEYCAPQHFISSGKPVYCFPTGQECAEIYIGDCRPVGNKFCQKYYEMYSSGYNGHCLAAGDHAQTYCSVFCGSTCASNKDYGFCCNQISLSLFLAVVIPLAILLIVLIAVTFYCVKTRQQNDQAPGVSRKVAGHAKRSAKARVEMTHQYTECRSTGRSGAGRGLAVYRSGSLPECSNSILQ